MKIKFASKNKFKPEILLERLHKIKTIKDDGKVSFIAFDSVEIEWILLSHLKFECEISVISKQEIVNKTLKEVAVKNIKDSGGLIDILNEKLKQHNSKPEKYYFLLSSISVNKLPFRKIKINDCEITISGKEFPIIFRSHRDELYKRNYQKSEHNNFLKVIVKTKGRDFKDTFDKAQNSLDIFRAFLCLYLNPLFQVPLNSVSLNPINRVVNGEFASLHYESGETVHKSLHLFRTNFQDKLYNLNQRDLDFIKKEVSWAINKYNSCKVKHRRSLGNVLKLYVNAFDEKDKYICFLKGWTALENLVDSDKNDEIINRCVSMYSSDMKSSQTLILEGLRIFRNELVHDGLNDLNPLVHCCQIQNFIYNLLIKFNLKYSGFFNNIIEANDFLDKNKTDLRDLEIEKKLLDKVIKTRSLK